jgi:hypothetical protein
VRSRRRSVPSHETHRGGVGPFEDVTAVPQSLARLAPLKKHRVHLPKLSLKGSNVGAYSNGPFDGI